MVSQNKLWMSYDSRVESGVEVVRTGPGTCLIGKEFEMYSKIKEKRRFITLLLVNASVARTQDICIETVQRDPSARGRTSRRSQRHGPGLRHKWQIAQHQLKKYQVMKRKKKKLARGRMPLLPIARRILWLQSRSCLWRIVMICWILWLSTLTRIFEMPKAIGLAAGNMYVQNVH